MNKFKNKKDLKKIILKLKLKLDSSDDDNTFESGNNSIKEEIPQIKQEKQTMNQP